MLAHDDRSDLDREIASTNVARRSLVVLLLGAACLAGGPLRQDVTSDSESQRRPSKDSVPIVYQSERFTPIPLTAQQIDEFLSTASKAMPKGPSVWFILVRKNREHDGDLDYSVTAYFAPDEQAARLRKGRYLHFSSFPKLVAAAINKAFADQPKDASAPAIKKQETDWTKRLRNYYQVSSSNQPFDKKLEVPNGPMLPFDAPEGFSADEIIDIVDFVRSNPTYTRPPSKEHPNSFTVPTRLDGSDPILGMKKKDDIIEVRTGTTQGPLSALGQFVRFVREGEDFKIISIGMWVS